MTWVLPFTCLPRKIIFPLEINLLPARRPLVLIIRYLSSDTCTPPHANLIDKQTWQFVLLVISVIDCAFRSNLSRSFLMKVLVAIDGSETALRALGYVLSHQDFFSTNPELVLINVHLPVPSAHARAILGSAVIEQYYKDEAAESLAKARELVNGKSCRVTEQLMVGQPANEIIAAAQRHGCDMIVMGTHGRGALGNLLMGSVAMRVIANSPIPVLSVK